MDVYHALRNTGPAVSLPSGCALLLVLIFSTTYNHRLLPYFRLLISIPATILFIAFSLPRGNPYPLRGLYIQFCSWGLWLLLKVLDVGVVGFREQPEERPRWIRTGIKNPGTQNGKKEKEDGKSENVVVLPMPTTLKDRLVYTFDLFISTRGQSLLKNRVFDFASPAVQNFNPPESRWQFAKKYFPTCALRYLRLDVFDTLSRLQLWDTTIEHPLMSLPFYQQVFYTITIGCTVMNSMPNTIATCMFASLLVLRSPTKVWPPVFDRPLLATSLADAWTHRWHAVYKRSFLRLSIPVLEMLPQSTPRQVKRIVKLGSVFWFSTILHLAHTAALTPDEQHTQLHFWNVPTIMFFMLQPVGLLFESNVVNPMTESLSPTKKLWARRAFFYCWIVWTGRYYVDGFLVQGILNPGSEWVPFSPVRGLWKGTWLQS